MIPVKKNVSRYARARPWVYEYTFYSPVVMPQGGQYYHLSTSDEVMPVVEQAIPGVGMKNLHVEKLITHNGYTSWRVST